MSDLSDIELSLASIESSVTAIQDSVAGIEQAANRIDDRPAGDLEGVERAVESLERTLGKIANRIDEWPAVDLDSIERAIESLKRTLGEIDGKLFDVRVNVDSIDKYSIDNALNLKWLYEKVRDSLSPERRTSRNFDWLLLGIFLVLIVHVVHHW